MSHHLPALLAVFTHPDDDTFRPGELLLCTPDELTVVCEVEMRCAYEALRLIFGSIPPAIRVGGKRPARCCAGDRSLLAESLSRLQVWE
jgi:hypothetical protein